jgi:heat shock protein HslJ
MSTLMACDGAVGAVEGRFVAALDGASLLSIDLEGRLVLDGNGGSITFAVAPPHLDS